MVINNHLMTCLTIWSSSLNSEKTNKYNAPNFVQISYWPVVCNSQSPIKLLPFLYIIQSMIILILLEWRGHYRVTCSLLCLQYILNPISQFILIYSCQHPSPVPLCSCDIIIVVLDSSSDAHGIINMHLVINPGTMLTDLWLWLEIYLRSFNLYSVVKWAYFGSLMKLTCLSAINIHCLCFIWHELKLYLSAE